MSMTKNRRRIVLGIAILLILAVAMVGTSNFNKKITNSGTIQIVAGENFWGSLVSQLGGSHVHVTDVVSDPNADPHEYSSNTNTARAFASANYVILNGAGYDSWGDKLLSASSNNNRKVLRVADLLGKKEGDNPHFWYSSAYVNQVVSQMEQDLIKIDPADKSYFQQQYVTLQTALTDYQSRIAGIKQRFSGVKVAAIEDIVTYLTDAAGLDLISPPAFIQAVAEGNDPPTNSVVEFQQQLQSGQPKVLVYNEQTITPLTDSIKKLATDQGIPIVGITETIQPPGTTFQGWMNSEVVNLQSALNTLEMRR